MSCIDVNPLTLKQYLITRTSKIFPFDLTIEVTKRCNLRCRHCYIPEYSSKEMTLQDISHILRQFADLGSMRLTLTGGEPLLRGDLFDIITEGKKLGYNIILYSNLLLLNEKRIKQLSNLKVNTVSTSIYGFSPESHEFITSQDNSFNLLMNNLRLLILHNIKLQAKIMLTNRNIN